MTVIEEQRKSLPNIERYFSGKTGLITGAASGIGRALAARLSGVSSLSLLDINSVGEVPPNVKVNQADIRDRHSLEHISGDLSQLDFLVLAAGVTQPHPGELTEEESALLMDINVDGTRNTFEVFSGKLNPGATVVFVSSDLAFRDDPNLPVYAKSKKEILEYALGVAQQRTDLRVIVLAPGPVRTPLFLHGKDESTLQRIGQAVGIYTPEKFAEEALRVIADPKAYPTNSVVRMYEKSGIELVSVDGASN